MLRILSVLSLSAVFLSPVLADAVIEEADFGNDFSNDSSNPTSFGSLVVGTTTVSGAIETPPQEIGPPDADIFTFTIDPGVVLDSVTLLSIDGDRHFFGLDDGNTSVDPNTGNGNQLLIATVVGDTSVNINLLGLSLAEQEFKSAGDVATVPLGPGDYTIWLQENSEGFFEYTLALQTSVTSIPEPSSVLALGLAGVCVAMRRRRRG